ncbi:MAG: nitrous oxide reductase accessory protein NosL [Sandaracinaceae bacterium]|nr:nitrous oxide reductase accessory protein NosL [Sandaracinaceae bacterium]
MDRRSFLVSSFVLSLALPLAACGGEHEGHAQAQGARRCDLCGMRINPSSGWRAGGRGASGQELAFDTPKCMFRFHHTRGAVSDPWIMEYYSQERRDARALRYALGSDVSGPMGRDLVPIEGEEPAARFQREHHATRILSFTEVTAAIVEDLFRPR